MDCQEVPEGYKVLYTPMAPGTYVISIKYGGPNHISGSPFKAKVTGEVASGSTTCRCVVYTTARVFLFSSKNYFFSDGKNIIQYL